MKCLKIISVVIASFTLQFSAGAAQSERFESLWKAYVKSTETFTLQEFCKPRLIKANPEVPFAGTIVLHHGFTACNQQFIEWGEKHLSANGFDVALVVLPGHGRVLTTDRKGRIHNDVSGFPTRRNYQKVYGDYVATVNELMKEALGIKMTGGLSVGAEPSVASVFAAPELYDRVILFSPFFRVSSEKKVFEKGKYRWEAFLQAVSRFLGIRNAGVTNLRIIAKLKQSWGKDCEVEEHEAGRNGYCEFTPGAISANQYYGNELINLAKKAKQFPPTQILAVEADPTASNFHTRLFADALEQSTQVRPSLCYFAKPVQHSMLSRFDSPNEKKFWLPYVLDRSTRFVTKGEFFPMGETLKSEEYEHLCGEFTASQNP